MGVSLVLKEILTVLVILEEVGGRHYQALAAEQEDVQLRTLFTMLSNDEARHRKTYGDLCRKLGLNADRLAEDELTIARILEEFDLGEPTSARLTMHEAVNGALAMEHKTLRYLTDLEEYIPEHEQPRLKQLVEEERKHAALLTDLRGRLK